MTDLIADLGMTQPPVRREDLPGLVGQELGVSRWITLDQSRIDAFAGVTEDHQFIHTDPDRAAAEGPFGGTVAHGFLTLSVLSALAYDGQPPIAGVRATVNYGFDRVRFVTPVRAGHAVRARFTLASAEEIAPAALALGWDVTVEIRGGDRPALVAHWLQRWYLG